MEFVDVSLDLDDEAGVAYVSWGDRDPTELSPEEVHRLAYEFEEILDPFAPEEWNAEFQETVDRLRAFAYDHGDPDPIVGVDV